METKIENLPYWLYSSQKFKDAIKEHRDTIFHNNYIPENEDINSMEDFMKMFDCCNEFQYNSCGIKYHLSLYAYYFINEEELKEVFGAIFEPKLRDISISYYIERTNIEKNSEEWELKILPLKDNVKITVQSDEFILIKSPDFCTYISKEYSHSELYMLNVYFIYYDLLNELFDLANFTDLINIVKNVNCKYSLFFTIFGKVYFDEKTLKFANLINIFIFLYELRSKVDESLKDGNYLYRRYFLKVLLEPDNYLRWECNNSIFNEIYGIFENFLTSMQPLDRSYSDYYKSESYLKIKEYVKTANEIPDIGNMFYSNCKYPENAIKFVS